MAISDTTTERTIEQQITEHEAQIARLRERKRTEENGQKIILGGMLLASARHEPRIAAWVVKEAEKGVTRDIDRKRLAPLLRELAEKAKQAPERHGTDTKPHAALI